MQPYPTGNTLKRGFAKSAVDLSTRSQRSFDPIVLETFGKADWWEEFSGSEQSPKESLPSAAIRKFHKLRRRVKRTISFGRSKDMEIEGPQADDDDIFYKPPKGDPYYADRENFDPLDLSQEGIERMREKLVKDTISRPMKLRKHPSKDLQALREQRSRERFRDTHPLPLRLTRPALRNMSTTPNLREVNKRDSGFIEDLLPEFPAPPVSQRSFGPNKPLIDELQEKRARLGSASMTNLTIVNMRWQAAYRDKPSTVTWLDRPGVVPPVPPLPPLPAGAARPRLPSQRNVSFRLPSSPAPNWDKSFNLTDDPFAA